MAEATPCCPAPVSAMSLVFPIAFGHQGLPQDVVQLMGPLVDQFPLYLVDRRTSSQKRPARG